MSAVVSVLLACLIFIWCIVLGSILPDVIYQYCYLSVCYLSVCGTRTNSSIIVEYNTTIFLNLLFPLNVVCFAGDNVICGSYDVKLSWFDMDLSTEPYKVLRYIDARVILYSMKYMYWLLLHSCGQRKSEKSLETVQKVAAAPEAPYSAVTY